ncbi:MAG: hypothetical protein PHS48_04525, partial [Bacteroidales bacterium]|nr:hypothetical protein [Bacteroidales bacterium]
AAMNGAASSDANPSCVQVVCPAGWHLSSDEEWTTHWEDPNTGATNESGFTALPGGYRSNFGAFFYFFCYEGFWWSSAQNNKSFAWGRNLGCDDSGVNRGDV